MIDPIVLHFATSGVADVSRAFETVAAKVRRFEEQATRASREGSRTRVRAAQDEAKAKERAEAKVAKEVERAEKQRTRETEREAKRRQSIERRSSEMAGRFAAQQVREEMRARQREAREVERLENYKIALRRRSAEMAGRFAAQEARAQEMANRRRGAALRGAFAGGGTLGRMGRGALGIMGATAGIGGALAIADAARGEFSSERTASLLIAADAGNSKPGVGEVVGQASQVSRELGIDRNELLGAALSYSHNARGGDIRGALASMSFFGKLSQVTGANIDDIAEAAGTLQSQNADLAGAKNAGKLQQMLLNTFAQAQQGSMSMVDAAKQIGTMASTRSAFAGDVARNQTALLGLGQIARAEGDAGEAGTFVKDLAIEAGNADKRFRAQTGRHLTSFDKYGRMASPEKLIEDTFRATHGNIQEIQSLFGIRGRAVFAGLQGDYVKAGGGEAGIAAVHARLQQQIGATMTPQDLEAKHRTLMDTPAERFAVAVNKVKTDLEEKLAPHLEHFATDVLPKLEPVFEKVIDAADKLADVFANHPIAGIGALILAAVANDLKSAAIGAGVKKAIDAAVSAMGQGGRLSVAAQSIAIAAGAVAITEAGMAAIDKSFADDAAAQGSAAVAPGRAINAAAAAQRSPGRVTGAQLNALVAQRSALKEQYAQEAQQLRNGPDRGFFGNLALVASPWTNQREDEAANQAALAKRHHDTADALERLNKAIDAVTKNMGTMASNTHPSSPSRNVPIAQRPVQ